MTTRNVKNSNQKKGKDLENRLITYLSRDLGYWAHFMHPAPDGSQPFDIIATRGIQDGSVQQVLAIDCKTLEGNRFPFTRAEHNQLASFRVLNLRGIHNTYFAIEVERGKVFFVPSQQVEKMIDLNKKSLDMEEWSKTYGFTGIK